MRQWWWGGGGRLTLEQTGHKLKSRREPDFACTDPDERTLRVSEIGRASCRERVFITV